MKRLMCVAMVVAVSLAAAVSAEPLGPTDVRLDGMKVTIVPLGKTVEIDPLEVVSREADLALPKGEPSWRTSPRLPVVAWTLGCLTRGSLVVTLADRPGAPLVEGKDYRVNWNWGALTAIEGGRCPAGTRVHCKFTYTLSRIDLVERAADGAVTVKKGKADRGEPLLPETSPGATPLVSVYLGPNTTRLTMDNVNLIDPAYDGVPPVAGAEFIAGTKAKLAAGKPVTIAFLGDSITAQKPKDFRDGKGSFVDRFTAYLKEKYPGRKVVVTPRDKVVPAADRQIVIVKAGVGGDNSARGLARVAKDVLPHKPDAVVVMFGANDENAPQRGGPNGVPPPAYGENLSKIVDKVRAAGAETILMTPSMKMLQWEHTAGNLNEYAAAARRVAREKKVCLVDCFKAWEDLPRRGYNYAVFLGTCINHPVDLGHDLFVRGLKAAFED